MPSYLREMNPQVWWMIDIGLSYILEDCPQTQGQKKYLYLEPHASNAFSSALSVEIKDEIKMEYDYLERANLLWNVLEQMYGSRNSKKLSSSAPENISSSSTLFYQSQEGQSSSQKEEAKSASLRKPDCPIFQTGLSDFDRIETSLAEEDDCSTSSSDDDDDTDDEYDEQELLVEFRKLIRNHMKLQKRHVVLLCSHKELIDSYALLESTHEVMIIKVKDSKSHTCTCAPPSID
jgi:hypothetical protein